MDTTALPELLEMAVFDHPTVRARRAALASAQAEVQAARGQYYPTPSISAQSRDGHHMSLVALQQPLWSGGRLAAGVDAAQAHVAVAELAVREAQFEVATRVLASWQAATSASARQQATTNGLHRLRQLSSMVERRLQTGLSGQVEMDLLQARLDQATTELTQAVADEEAALATLSQLTGRPVRPAPPPPVMEPPASEHADDLVVKALASSAQLKRLDAEVESASRDVDLAQASVRPTLYLRLELQGGRIAGSQEPGPRASIGFEQSFGPGMGAVAAAGVEGALAKRSAAQDSVEAAIRDVRGRVMGEAIALRSALAQEKVGESSLRSLAAVSDSYQRMFLVGKRSWLELLNALREQTDAERQLLTARAQRAAAEYRLQLSTGGFAWMQ